MPNKMAVPNRFAKRNPSSDSERARKQDARYQAAFLGMARSLACRPEPRSRFDEVAQGDARPWRHVVEPALACVAAGAPREDVAEFFAELIADVMGQYPQSDALTIEQSALEVFRVSSSAIPWLAASLVSREPAVLEMAERLARAEVAALAQYLTVLGETIRNRTSALRSGRYALAGPHTPVGE